MGRAPSLHRPGSGPLQRAPAGLKLAVSVGLILVVVLLPHDAWRALGAVAGLIALLAVAARVPAGRLLLRLVALEPFVVSVALLSLFQPNGTQVFARMVARSTLSLACVLLLTATTRFHDLVAVLARVGVPPILVTTMMLMARYLFLLIDEQQRMRRARRARTFRGDAGTAWRGAAQLVALLFVRASERGERVHAAMRARGLGA